ncbi:NUDIX hydrolase [Rhodobacteraceae bacterium WD3A24]|nr:NUDIX hydrolase [Rhodobacteraceae bacterium WD3A24]
MIRRFGPPPQRGRHYRRRMGVYAIVMRDGQVLLTHQAAPVPEYQLPGGGVEVAESPLRALYREVWEETGWIIGAPRRLGAFRRYAYMPEYDLWAEKLCIIYRVVPVRARAAPVEPGHRAVWLPTAAAAACLGNEGDRAFLRAQAG